jgi:dGTPase
LKLREISEQQELTYLHPKGLASVNSKGRSKPEEKCILRTDFQRDRDRIIHSKSFRRLSRKTQVFLNPDGDHYRTRLSHTLEVTQIARTIAISLRLNEDLVEAIGLGHDLGHTPFGHSGESVLNQLSSTGFHHAKQSLRIVEFVENSGSGLNLTAEVKEGIAKHSKGRGDILTEDPKYVPQTLEGQIIRLADIIAYVNHDLEDGIRAGIIKETEIPDFINKTLGKGRSARIGNLILSVAQYTDLETMDYIKMEEDSLKAVNLLRDFLYENCYYHPELRKEFEKAERLLSDLWKYFEKNPQEYCKTGGSELELIDYLSGMTDRYATRIWRNLSIPRSWFTHKL